MESVLCMPLIGRPSEARTRCLCSSVPSMPNRSRRFSTSAGARCDPSASAGTSTSLHRHPSSTSQRQTPAKPGMSPRQSRRSRARLPLWSIDGRPRNCRPTAVRRRPTTRPLRGFALSATLRHPAIKQRRPGPTPRIGLRWRRGSPRSRPASCRAGALRASLERIVREDPSNGQMQMRLGFVLQDAGRLRSRDAALRGRDCRRRAIGRTASRTRGVSRRLPVTRCRPPCARGRRPHRTGESARRRQPRNAGARRRENIGSHRPLAVCTVAGAGPPSGAVRAGTRLRSRRPARRRRARSARVVGAIATGGASAQRSRAADRGVAVDEQRAQNDERRALNAE